MGVFPTARRKASPGRDLGLRGSPPARRGRPRLVPIPGSPSNHRTRHCFRQVDVFHGGPGQLDLHRRHAQQLRWPRDLQSRWREPWDCEGHFGRSRRKDGGGTHQCGTVSRHGPKDVAVSFAALQMEHGATKPRIVIDATKEELQSAPNFPGPLPRPKVPKR
jgi:hypothetical protein